MEPGGPGGEEDLHPWEPEEVEVVQVLVVGVGQMKLMEQGPGVQDPVELVLALVLVLVELVLVEVGLLLVLVEEEVLVVLVQKTGRLPQVKLVWVVQVEGPPQSCREEGAPGGRGTPVGRC